MQSHKAQHQHFRSRAHMHIHAAAKYSWANAWPNVGWTILVKYNQYGFFLFYFIFNFILLPQWRGELNWFRVWHLLGAAVNRQYGGGLTDRCSGTSWFQASSKPSSHPFASLRKDEKSSELIIASRLKHFTVELGSSLFYLPLPPRKQPFKHWLDHPSTNLFFLTTNHKK